MGAVVLFNLTLALLCAAQDVAGTSSATVPDIVEVLRSRERSLDRVLMDYSVVSQGRGGKPSRKETGWVVLDGYAMAYGFEVESRGHLTIRYHGIWNGAKTLQRAGGPEMAVPRLPSLTDVGDAEGEFSAFNSLAPEIMRNAAAPTQFGLRLGMFSWSEVLRDAAVVQFGAGPNELLVPTLRLDFWGIDSLNPARPKDLPPRTLFVGRSGDCVPIRSTSYVTPETAIEFGATAETLERHKRSINGGEWIVFQEWTIESIQRCGDREIPRTATLRHPACPDLVDSTLEVRSAIMLSRTEAAEIFRLEGFASNLANSDKSKAILMGDPLLKGKYQAILAAGVPVGVADAVIRNADLLRGASCGPAALFALAQLCGRDVSMNDLQSAFDPSAYAAENVSLRDLSTAAKLIGLEYVEHRQSNEDRFRDFRLVHLADPVRGTLHFSVAFPSTDPDLVVLFDPPVGARRLTWSQFAKYWTGYSLAPIESVSKPISKWVWAAIGVGLIAFGVATRRFKGAGLKSAAAVGICSFLISCGNSTGSPEPKAAQLGVATAEALPLEVVGGASSLRCGVVERGAMGAARFGILNAAREQVQIHEIKKTCGCTTFELSRDILAPGEVAEATAWVDTTNVSGEFSVEVSLLADDGKPLGLFVITGRSVEGNRIRIEPDLIEISYGATPGSRIAELTVSGDSEEMVRELSGIALSVSDDCAAILGEFGAPTVVGARVERRAPILLGGLPSRWGGSALVTVRAPLGVRVVSGRAVIEFQNPGFTLESSSVFLGVVSASQQSERFVGISSVRPVDPALLRVTSSVSWIEARVVSASAGVGVLLSYRPTAASTGVVRGELEVYYSDNGPPLSVPIVAVVDSL